MRWRFLLGATLLAAQAAAVVRGRFVDDRYFCWAPFDQQTQYHIYVSIAGEPLTDWQVSQRYRRPAAGVDNRAAVHLFDIIRRTEPLAEKWNRSKVVVEYQVNGGPMRVWRYPE